MSAVLQLCIRLLPFPTNIPCFLICVFIRSPRQAAQSSRFLTWKRLWNSTSKMHLSVMFPFRTKEKKGTDSHLQGHSPLVMMFVTNHAKLRSKCQQFQCPSTTKPITSLKSTRGSKGWWLPLGKETWQGCLQDWTLQQLGAMNTCSTAIQQEKMIRSTQKAHSFSSPLLYTIRLDSDLKGRSPTAALECCLCGCLFAKLAVNDTSHPDSK